MQLGSNFNMVALVLLILRPPTKACGASLDLSKFTRRRFYLYFIILIFNGLLVLPVYSLPNSRGIL